MSAIMFVITLLTLDSCRPSFHCHCLYVFIYAVVLCVLSQWHE